MKNIALLLGDLLEYYQESVADFSQNIKLVDKVLVLDRPGQGQGQAPGQRPGQEPGHHNVRVSSQIWEDLGVFSRDGVFKNLQRCHTYFGFLTQVYTLLYPSTYKNPYLDYIKPLTDNTQEKAEYVESLKCLEEIREKQNDILWFWKEKSKEEEKLYENIYFSHSYLTKLNKNRLSLLLYYVYRTLIQPIYVVISPLLCFIIPYIVLRFKMGLSLSVPIYLKILGQVLPASFGILKQGQQSPKKMVWVYLSTLFSAIFYVQTVYAHIIQVGTLIETSKRVKKRLLSLHQVIALTTRLHELLKFKDPLPQIPWYLADITNNDTTPSFSWRYWLLREEKFNLIPEWLGLLGKLDMIISLVTIIRELGHRKLPVCYPNWEPTNKISHISALDIWNPGLLETGSEIITNHFELGGPYKRNMLVSGPNAGGKSTLVKAICLNCLLAETFGFTTTSQFTFTPYHLIYTHFRIQDNTGEKSLFQEEVNRCQFLFQHLPQENFLTIFDELFCSTSVLEGISCAYSLAELMGTYSQGTTIITTHYPLLDELSETPSSYLNSKMDCQIYLDKPVFSYKLLRGISDCHVALHLLNSSSETENLVRKSRLLLEKLLAENKSKFIFSKKSIST